MKHRIHWCKWEKLCKPKEVGGLNFRDLETFNKALLAKQGWRIFHNPDSTVVRILKGKYFPSSSLLETTCSQHSSYFWKGLICALDLLKAGMRRNIGNGQSINLVLDPWIPMPQTFEVV